MLAPGDVRIPLSELERVALQHRGEIASRSGCTAADDLFGIIRNDTILRGQLGDLCIHLLLCVWRLINEDAIDDAGIEIKVGIGSKPSAIEGGERWFRSVCRGDVVPADDGLSIISGTGKDSAIERRLDGERLRPDPDRSGAEAVAEKSYPPGCHPMKPDERLVLLCRRPRGDDINGGIGDIEQT